MHGNEKVTSQKVLADTMIDFFSFHISLPDFFFCRSSKAEFFSLISAGNFFFFKNLPDPPRISNGPPLKKKTKKMTTKTKKIKTQKEDNRK